MIHLAPGLLGRVFDFGETLVTEAMVRRYAKTVGDRETLQRLQRGEIVAPPTFCLSLHRGMRPVVELPPELFGVYGGHDLEFLEPLRVGGTYRVSSRIVDVYEKSGRSGALTIVAREGELRDAAANAVVARIHERQIIRRRPETPAPAPRREQSAEANAPADTGMVGVADVDAPIELGTELGPLLRPGTPTEQVGGYVDSGEMRDELFTDARYARDLGYRGIVVPGPMLTAFLEQFVRGALPAWRLEKLGSTFRQPTITGDPLKLHGVVSEHHETADGEHVVCDLVIEHPSGERGVTATARLKRVLSS